MSFGDAFDGSLRIRQQDLGQILFASTQTSAKSHVSRYTRIPRAMVNANKRVFITAQEIVRGKKSKRIAPWEERCRQHIRHGNSLICLYENQGQDGGVRCGWNGANSVKWCGWWKGRIA